MDSVTKTRKAIIGIQGMTCHSCVKQIEQNLGDQPGVISIKVSLSDEEGIIIFSLSKTNADRLVQKIEDSGFDASLKSVVEVEHEQEFTTEVNDKNMVSIELRGGIFEIIILGFPEGHKFWIEGWRICLIIALSSARRFYLL